jgi:NACHT domain
LESSTIIQDIRDLREAGLATIAYFYFDFRDASKRDTRSLLSSLLVQICAQSDPYCEILADLYSKHDRGSQQPSGDALLRCLRKVLEHPGQGPLYLIIDALDECPSSSGFPTQRERALKIVQELVKVPLPHLHVCITSRPEIDIRAVLEPLAAHNVSLHNESGQNQDIIDYIHSVVRSDPKMQKWREEDKTLVIDTLTLKASGM